MAFAQDIAMRIRRTLDVSTRRAVKVHPRTHSTKRHKKRRTQIESVDDIREDDIRDTHLGEKSGQPAKELEVVRRGKDRGTYACHYNKDMKVPSTDHNQSRQP